MGGRKEAGADMFRRLWQRGETKKAERCSVVLPKRRKKECGGVEVQLFTCSLLAPLSS